MKVVDWHSAYVGGRERGKTKQRYARSCMLREPLTTYLAFTWILFFYGGSSSVCAWLGPVDGEAYIGDEYLVPGSTPLHIAVIIGNISIVHAILQVSCL